MTAPAPASAVPLPAAYEVLLDDTWAYGAGVLHGGWLLETVTSLALTIELSVLLRCAPVDGWLRVVQRATSVHGGWLDEQCEVWDSAGQLVAQARQLAGYRQP